MKQSRAEYDEFTESVRQLCQQPGIRRALGTGRGRPVAECTELHRYLRDTRCKPARRAYYTVASLIALTGPPSHDDHDTPCGAAATSPPGADNAVHEKNADTADTTSAWFRRPNLGTTLATAIHEAGYDEERTEKKLRLLTRLSEDQLHRRLPSEITRLNGKGLHPDWAVLLGDLVERHYDHHRINLRWYDAFADALDTPDIPVP
ncbi:type I-E CRISPR-associated protein Cse2/CasB [Streptomyces sp. NPDC051956]|uniref:type I-E CRISPR-associated protein Cse2/CasB n=1 Tax=Streptomyces sp. NPDC051956 TaxID=3365677 RepID=UPI0037D2E9E8